MSRSSLSNLAKKFFESDLAAAAHALETMEAKEAMGVLTAIPPTLAIQVFPYLPVSHAVHFLHHAPAPLIKDVMESVEPRQSAAIFKNLPKERQEELLFQISDKAKLRIQEMLAYPEDSAGRIMSADFIAFHTEIKVKEAIQKLRSMARTNTTHSYVYVVDPQNQLVGILNMRDLLVASSDAKIGDIMRTGVFCINAFTDREQVAEELSSRRYFAAPVVDAQNHLLGVVKADELIQDVQEEASEDILRMFGAGRDEKPFSTLGFAVKKRLPWLYVNLGTAFLAASVVGLFEDIIAKITILAVFLPVVAGQGGNAGAQSLAVVMRGLVMHEIPRDKIWKSIIRETILGLTNGLMIGLVTGAIAWVWGGNPYLGLVMCLAMVANLLAAGFAGAAIPLGMKALGGDPAQSSNIVLTTVTDVIGFFSFLGFAVLFQSRLLS